MSARSDEDRRCLLLLKREPARSDEDRRREVLRERLPARSDEDRRCLVLRERRDEEVVVWLFMVGDVNHEAWFLIKMCYLGGSLVETQIVGIMKL